MELVSSLKIVHNFLRLCYQPTSNTRISIPSSDNWICTVSARSAHQRMKIIIITLNLWKIGSRLTVNLGNWSAKSKGEHRKKTQRIRKRISEYNLSFRFSFNPIMKTKGVSSLSILSINLDSSFISLWMSIKRCSILR